MKEDPLNWINGRSPHYWRGFLAAVANPKLVAQRPDIVGFPVRGPNAVGTSDFWWHKKLSKQRGREKQALLLNWLTQRNYAL